MDAISRHNEIAEAEQRLPHPNAEWDQPTYRLLDNGELIILGRQQEPPDEQAA